MDRPDIEAFVADFKVAANTTYYAKSRGGGGAAIERVLLAVPQLIKYIESLEAPKKPKKKAPEKINYADRVSLTKKQYDTLVKKHGEDQTREMIELLDDYKFRTDTRYKSDYRAILNWVAEEVIGRTVVLRSMDEIKKEAGND
jgi:hypothetical protein